MSTSTTSVTRDRALELLGNGVGIESVAAALGVTASTISQLLADPIFYDEVAALKFKHLAKHNERDALLDGLEDTLIGKLAETLPMLFKPMEITKALQVVNAAKRRGVASQEGIASQAQIVKLIIPQLTLQQFTSNTHNQVIVAGEQNLTTMQSGALLRRLKESTAYESESPQQQAVPEQQRLQIGRNSPIPAGA